MSDPISNQVDEQINYIKGVIEALLFVNEKPVTLEQFKGVLETVNAATMARTNRTPIFLMMLSSRWRMVHF